MNAVEAWQRSFNVIVECNDSNIWKIVTAPKREQGLVEIRHAKYIAGDQAFKQNTTQANE